MENGAEMDEGRKRVLAIIAGILVSKHLDRADDLFGGPDGSPRTDRMIAAAVQWGELILKKIDKVFGAENHLTYPQKNGAGQIHTESGKKVR